MGWQQVDAATAGHGDGEASRLRRVSYRATQGVHHGDQGEQPFFRAVADRYANDPAWHIHNVDSGHDVMIDNPDALTAILDTSI